MIDPMTDPAVRGPLLADTQATGAVHALAVLLATVTVGRTRLPADLMTPRAQALALALGATVDSDGVTVRGRGLGGLIEPEAPLDVRGWPDAGCVLVGLLASHPVTAVVLADALPEGLGAVLEAVGARVAGPSAAGACRTPLTVQGTGRAMVAPMPEGAEPWPLGLARLAAGLNTAGRTEAVLPPGAGGVVADVLAAFGVPVSVAPQGAGLRLKLEGEAETRPASLPPDWPARPAWMAGPDGAGGSPVTVAVDGPAAAGKGTLARALAACLGFAYLDTGLLYRATGMAVRRTGGDPGDPATAEAAARALQPSDLSAPDLRGETAGDAASRVAAIPGVRAALLDFQRSVAAAPPDGAPGAVLDGRDIGSVVCPDAAVKLFVTARLETRAHRRFLELRARDGTVIETAILQDMKARDARDSSRGVAPLVPAADAVVLDTSDMDRADALAAALAVTGQALRACARGAPGTVTADGAGHQTGDS